jgi:hypothetical protein
MSALHNDCIVNRARYLLWKLAWWLWLIRQRHNILLVIESLELVIYMVEVLISRMCLQLFLLCKFCIFFYNYKIFVLLETCSIVYDDLHKENIFLLNWSRLLINVKLYVKLFVWLHRIITIFLLIHWKVKIFICFCGIVLWFGKLLVHKVLLINIHTFNLTAHALLVLMEWPSLRFNSTL